MPPAPTQPGPSESGAPALHPRTAYIALGANLPSAIGPPAATLHAAVQALSPHGHITARSSLYQTEPVGPIGSSSDPSASAPVGNSGQPVFLNAVIALQTSLDPEALLDCLLAIERRFGRDRASTPAKGPRTLDLDLLLLDSVVLNTPSLTLPHPALAERRFVLAPLAEIAPTLVHPTLHRTIASLLAALPDEGANRIAAVHRLQHSA